MGYGKFIAIIGGVAVGAIGAYNYSTTGCPLGTTSETDLAATPLLQTVAADGDACSLGCSTDEMSLAQVSVESEPSESVNIESSVAAATCSAPDADAVLLCVSEDLDSTCCEVGSPVVEEAENTESGKPAESDG